MIIYLAGAKEPTFCMNKISKTAGILVSFHDILKGRGRITKLVAHKSKNSKNKVK